MKQLLFFLLCISGLLAQSNKVEALPEYTLKAAYVYNFALLTDWPKEKRAGDFVICLPEEHVSNDAFLALREKKIGNQFITMGRPKIKDDFLGCHILFLSKHNQNQNILKHTAKHPILIVTDDEALAQAHIQILEHNERLVFSINLGALQKSNLTLSSRLLQLAKEVTP
ncbi:MAG: YfiR family protein [Campylobacterales bacterium]|nr:YfiR family protein [Campylobacterales bacterium]